MKYELMVILSPKQTDKEVEKNLKEIKTILTENAYDVVDEDLWGMRDLAYRIGGNTKGYYAVFNFVGEPKGMPVVNKDLQLQPGVIRHLLIKVPDDYVLMRYDQLGTTQAAKLSSPAEELSKKVRGQTRVKAKSPSTEETPQAQETEKLDETLKAIIEDKDIV